MPGYRTHITASSVCGAVLGAAAWRFGDISAVSSVFAGSLCAIGGLIPDIDSKTSQSFRRCLAILAGFSSLLLVSRLRDFPLDAEAVAIIGGGNFVLVWFFIGRLIQKLTVHRGMCHSIPMAIISGEIIFLLSSGSLFERNFNGMAIFLGVMIHLTLDEFYSVETGAKSVSGVRLKKSFGSALKLINFDDWKSSLVMFAILAFLTNLAINESAYTQRWEAENTEQKTSQFIALDRQGAIQRFQTKYPNDFDRAVIQWAVENDLRIIPATADNKKWASMKAAFASERTP